MAKKEPQTVDRFRVSCEVPKEQLGHIIAELAKMQLEHVNYELITDVLNYKKAQKYETTSAEHLREWIKDHPTFNRQEVIAHFAATGRSQESASNAIYVLAREKLLKKLGEGNYQRADVKAIAGPKKQKLAAAVTSKKQRSHQQRYEISNIDYLLAKFRNRKKFTVREAEDCFAADQRPKKSVWPLLFRLAAMNKLKKLGNAEYTVAKRTLTARKSKLNGAAVEEAVTNG